MIDVGVGAAGEAEGEDIVFDGAGAVETPEIGRDALGEGELKFAFGGRGI